MIKELEKRLHSEYQADIQSEDQRTVNSNDLERIKNPLESQQSPPLGALTPSMSTGQHVDIADNSSEKHKHQIPFEVLIENERNETNDEVEYILADSDYNPNDTDADSSKSDTFGGDSSNPTCYELSDQTNADLNELEETKQNIGTYMRGIE